MNSLQNVPEESVDLKNALDFVLRTAKGMWRFRRIGLLLAWAACLLVWPMVYLLPDEYQASARVYVDAESVLRPLLRGLSVETDLSSDVNVMTRAMVSRPSLERVASETDLDVRASTPLDYERLLNSLAARIAITRDRENIYSISFSDRDREMAVKVVSTFLDAFVEDTLGSKQEDSQQAESTLKAQIEEYEQRLNEADNRLKKFKQQNVGMMPSDRGDYYEQLQTAMSELTAVQQKIGVAERTLNVLRRQIEGEEPVLGIMAGSSTATSPVGRTSMDARIAEMETQISDLRLRYTDQHPEVVRAQAMLKEYEERRREEVSLRPTPSSPVMSSGGQLEMNPVYQSMKIQLGNAEVDLATLTEELNQKQAAVDHLRKMVNVIPEVEAELARLNRDYGVVKLRYEEMLKRWENLQTSQRVRSSSEGIQFRIIEPPFAASLPVGPNRQLFILAGLFFSLGAAGAVAFLLNLFRPVFNTTTELTRHYDLPIAGYISAADSAPDASGRAERYDIVFFAGTGALLLAAVFVVVFSSPASLMLRSFL